MTGSHCVTIRFSSVAGWYSIYDNDYMSLENTICVQFWILFGVSH